MCDFTTMGYEHHIKITNWEVDAMPDYKLLLIV